MPNNLFPQHVLIQRNKLFCLQKILICLSLKNKEMSYKRIYIQKNHDQAHVCDYFDLPSD